MRHDRRQGQCRRAAALGSLVLTGLAALGACQPEDVTGARDRLGDGPARTVTFHVPLFQETYDAKDFLKGVETLIRDGLITIPVPADSVRAAVGADLLDDGRAEVEGWKELAPASVDLGELEDAVGASELRSARVQVSLRSTAGVDVRVIDPVMGAVRLDASGDPRRKPSGALDLEEDDAGQPLVVRLADAPGDSLLLPPGGQVRVEREAAPLVDRVLELVTSEERVAPALIGAARVAPGDRAGVAPSDRLVLGHRLLVGLDLVLPDTGVVIRRTELGEGLGLSVRDADDVQDRVLRSGGSLVVGNGVPFRVQTQIVWLSGDRRGSDVFGDPDRVTMDTLSVGAGRVGDDGRVTRERVDTLQVSLSGAEVRPLLLDVFTAGMGIRLLPPRTASGRGALTEEEELEVGARARVELRSGRR